MKLDKYTLQVELDRHLANAKTFESAIVERQDIIKRLEIEMHQHNGALSHARMVADDIRKKLVELSSTEPSQ